VCINRTVWPTPNEAGLEELGVVKMAFGMQSKDVLSSNLASNTSNMVLLVVISNQEKPYLSIFSKEMEVIWEIFLYR
jgi:hypothetical protein